MSIITYKVGAKEYSIESKLQLKDIPLIAVEENLNEEVRLDIQKRELERYGCHDIRLSDDNGLVAVAEDLNVGKLKLL